MAKSLWFAHQADVLKAAALAKTLMLGNILTQTPLCQGRNWTAANHGKHASTVESRTKFGHKSKTGGKATVPCCSMKRDLASCVDCLTYCPKKHGRRQGDRHLRAIGGTHLAANQRIPDQKPLPSRFYPFCLFLFFRGPFFLPEKRVQIQTPALGGGGRFPRQSSLEARPLLYFSKWKPRVATDGCMWLKGLSHAQIPVPTPKQNQHLTFRTSPSLIPGPGPQNHRQTPTSISSLPTAMASWPKGAGLRLPFGQAILVRSFKGQCRAM